MRRAGNGSIINISASSSKLALPARPAYQSSKGAINALTRQIGRRLRQGRTSAPTRSSSVSSFTGSPQMTAILADPTYRARVREERPHARSWVEPVGHRGGRHVPGGGRIEVRDRDPTHDRRSRAILPPVASPELDLEALAATRDRRPRGGSRGPHGHRPRRHRHRQNRTLESGEQHDQPRRPDPGQRRRPHLRAARDVRRARARQVPRPGAARRRGGRRRRAVVVRRPPRPEHRPQRGRRQVARVLQPRRVALRRDASRVLRRARARARHERRRAARRARTSRTGPASPVRC